MLWYQRQSSVHSPSRNSRTWPKRRDFEATTDPRAVESTRDNRIHNDMLWEKSKKSIHRTVIMRCALRVCCQTTFMLILMPWNSGKCSDA